MSEQVIIYTDGGCEPNPGVGGWAAVMLFGQHRKELSGGELESTNNRMELKAAIESLKTLTRPCIVTIYTDSQYVRLGITQWMADWKAKGWKRKTGAIKNLDLWREVDELAAQHTIEWAWVKGHSGVDENERCDELASMAIAQMRDNVV
ncbi:MAG: ribonuclease HI [Candidatus Hydrogenedentota bacterium]